MATQMLDAGVNIIPDSFVCISCNKEITAKKSSAHVESDNEDCEFNDGDCDDLDATFQLEQVRSKVDHINETLGISPTRTQGLSSGQKRRYGERKAEQAHKAYNTLFKSAMNIPQHDENLEPSVEYPQSKENMADDMNKLLSDIKSKFQSEKNYAAKVQLLTLTPKSWSKAKAEQYFGASNYMVRKAFLLRDIAGILAKPASYKRQKLSAATLNAVDDFYHDDDNSRQLPGLKDYIKVDGVQRKKRLLLCTLKELYRSFTETHSSMKISFSKFCELRPKWCVMVGAKGTHTVCTCIKHENAKLLSANTDFDYKV